MARNSNRKLPEVSSGSMADIAFLLLIFFLVTTTIANDKGILIILPPPDSEAENIDIDIPKKNLFTILANSNDDLLVEGGEGKWAFRGRQYKKDFSLLTEDVKKFILNFGDPSEEGVKIYNSLPPNLKSYVNQYGRDPNSSDDPASLTHGGGAIVSFKAQRGTSYELYIDVLDAINAAYNEIYGARVGLSAEEFLALDKRDEAQKELYERARDGIPRAISIAKPD
jgi:biopolymer transport protein ExbD